LAKENGQRKGKIENMPVIEKEFCGIGIKPGHGG
jgi:hypothetical protein